MSIRPIRSDIDTREFPSTVPPTTTATAVAARVPDDRQRWPVYVVLAFWLIGLAAFFSATAYGQYLKPIPLPATMQNESRREGQALSEARKFARGEQSDVNLVKEYFRGFIPAVLTDPQLHHRHAKAMVDFNKVLKDAESASQRRALIATYVYPYMKVIAERNFHPVARINALTILAQLDETPGTSRELPVPYRDALPVLVRVYANESNPDGVRAAALHGMHRHVSYGFARLPANYKSGLSKLMNQLLDSPPPSGRSADAHAYMQRFAVDMLDKLRSGGDADLGQKLISISTEKSRPDLIAFHSAERLGPLGAELKGKVDDPNKILDSWSRRVLQLMDDEVDRLLALDRDETVGGSPEPSEFLPERLKEGTRKSVKTKQGGGTTSALEQMLESGGPRGGSAAPSKPKPKKKKSALELMLEESGGGAVQESDDSAAAQPPEVVASRSRLSHAFQQLHVGVTGYPMLGMPSRSAGGLLASVGDDARGQIENWVTKMQPIVEEINDENLATRREYVNALRDQIEVLRELVGPELVEEPVIEAPVIEAPVIEAPGDETSAEGQPVADNAQPAATAAVAAP